MRHTDMLQSPARQAIYRGTRSGDNALAEANSNQSMGSVRRVLGTDGHEVPAHWRITGAVTGPVTTNLPVTCLRTRYGQNYGHITGTCYGQQCYGLALRASLGAGTGRRGRRGEGGGSRAAVRARARGRRRGRRRQYPARSHKVCVGGAPPTRAVAPGFSTAVPKLEDDWEHRRSRRTGTRRPEKLRAVTERR